jgi:hypothetical protein
LVGARASIEAAAYTHAWERGRQRAAARADLPPRER